MILRRFVAELPEGGMILVLPIASEDPTAAAQDYLDVLPELGAARVAMLNITTRAQANEEATLRLLEEAAGVLFTGGDQLRLTALLGGTAFLRRLKERYTTERFVIAGTSAGATATRGVQRSRRRAPVINDRAEMDRPGALSALYRDQLCDLLCLHVLRLANIAPGPARGGLTSRAGRKVRAFLDASLDADVGLDALAAVVGLSLSQFHRAVA